MVRNFRHKRIAAADVRRDYAPLAATYETRWHAFNAAQRDWILARLPESLPAGARMLELGCGPGGFLAALQARHPGLNLVGLDMTPALLGRARAAVPDALLVEGDAEAPPLRSAAFDVVCSLNVLHHLNDPQRHLAALARLCRPGGTVFLCTFAGGATLPMRLADLWLRLRNPAWQGMLSPAALRRELAQEPTLTVAEHAVLKVDRFWRLQVYRLERSQRGTAGTEPWL